MSKTGVSGYAAIKRASARDVLILAQSTGFGEIE